VSHLAITSSWQHGEDVCLWQAYFPSPLPDLWLSGDYCVNCRLWVSQLGQLSLPSLWGW